MAQDRALKGTTGRENRTVDLLSKVHSISSIPVCSAGAKAFSFVRKRKWRSASTTIRPALTRNLVRPDIPAADEDGQRD